MVEEKKFGREDKLKNQLKFQHEGERKDASASGEVGSNV